MTVATAAPGEQRAVYMIALRDAPLVENAMSHALFGAKSPRGGRQAMRDALASPQSAAYLAQLDASRNGVVDLASRVISRPLVPTQVYTHAANGMALELTQAEAARIATLPGVLAVRRERILHVHTDVGPQWIGADALWSGQAGIATKGEGVVIGVIDTGINPTHPSFAATDAGGYTHVNSRAGYLGLCASARATCNAKLIGIYDYSNEGTNGIDAAGHGSHVSAIAAGNAIAASLHGMTADVSRNVSGVAPHANLIMYKACNAAPIDASQGDGTCAESWLVKAIDQAIADHVDVINYSIGGDTVDPYALLADRSSDAYAFFQARAAGIVIAVAAGNEGPSANTLSEPSNAPWVIGVANVSHNRRLINALKGTTGTGTSSPFIDLVGQGFTAGYGPASVVYAGDYGNALCGKGASVPSPPDGSSNPWPSGTFHGEIVICDRGTYGRVEKGYNLKAAGAGGMILANAAGDGESTVSDDHYLPAVHLGYQEGQVVKSWAHSYAPLRSSISGVAVQLDATFGDVLDGSSSRGPYGFGGGVLKPDLAAPGSNILSASNAGNGLALMTGTSMASPHVAGSAALLLSAHHDWTPAQVESALIGSALAGSVRKEDGATPAAVNDTGAGRAQLAPALNAGLFLPLNTADFAVADGSAAPPLGQHGDLRKLNRPGIEDEHCFQQCAFTRTVTDMSGGGTWQATATATTGAKITVTPAEFTLAAGASQSLAIAVDVSDPGLPGKWVGGRIVLHKTGGGRSASDFASTAAIYADPGVAPAFADIYAATPSGVTTLNLSGLVPLPQVSYTPMALVVPDATTMQLGVDPDPSSLYSTPNAAGRQFTLFKNPDFSGIDSGVNAPVFIVEIAASNAPSVSLYAGIDRNADGQPQQGEQVCQASTTAGSNTMARCVVDLRAANQAGAVAGVARNNVWVLVDVPQGTAGTTYSISLASGFPAQSYVIGPAAARGSITVTGPGQVPALTNFPLRLAWTPALGNVGWTMASGQRYFGAVAIGAVPVTPNAATAILPFALTYAGGNDDQTMSLPNANALIAAAGPQSFHTLYVDVPQGADTLRIDSSNSAPDSAGAVTFELVRADFPDFSSSSQVTAAPSISSPPTWTLAPSSTASSVTIPVTPGRWYVTAQTAAAAGFHLNPQLTYSAGAASGIAPGAYYNPKRSGHGVFLSQGGNQQVLDWYTYLEDGTPTWYTAQAAVPSPAGALWTAALLRVNWSGAKVNSAVPVGSVSLARINDNDMMFSWHLDGQSGSERFTRLGAGACPNFNGAPTNFNGAWYVPAQSGYGLDALALPDQLFTAFYFYDALGLARWGVGTAQPFAPANALALTQSNGFCPSCDYRKVTAQALGTMSIGYANSGSGTLSTNLMLQAPLSGAWTVDQQALARLTGAPSTCTQ
jgi:subtilisin family serine protease